MAVELEGGCRVVSANETEGFAGPPSLEVLQLGAPHEFFDAQREQLLYLVEHETSIYVPPGERVTVSELGTVVLSTCPRRRDAAEPAGDTPARLRLAEVPRQTTGDRWYCELIQGETTQFVGSIPPGRAPDHFHLYEEVLYILSGEGIMHAGSKSAPIGPGSRIYLPRRQRHCVENTGSGELRLLGVFYPAGSPAVRYPA
jgi:mannose-6-phosphate isomerase-like protein (cupin superfamily)